MRVSTSQYLNNENDHEKKTSIKQRLSYYEDNQKFDGYVKRIPQSEICPALCVLCQCTVVFIKMSSFLFVRSGAMPRMLDLSCGIPFPV